MDVTFSAYRPRGEPGLTNAVGLKFVPIPRICRDSLALRLIDQQVIIFGTSCTAVYIEASDINTGKSLWRLEERKVGRFAGEKPI
jgi:hypothetical protein